jgi:uncharacterized protein (DUF58 family)
MSIHPSRTERLDFVNDNTHSRTGSTATATRTRGATVTRYATGHTGLAAGADAGRRFASRVSTAVRRGWIATARTVRPAGWLLIAVLVLGSVAALLWGWAEGWIVAVMAALLTLLCAPFLLGSHKYEVGLALERDRVVAGDELEATLTVKNTGRRAALRAVLDIPVGEGLVEAHIPFMRSQATHSEALTISAARRGVIAVGPLTIGRGDPLGLAQRDYTWPDVQQIHVHPVTVAVPPTSAGLLRDLEGATTKTVVDSDLSFHAIRDYAHGDSRRHIHWRSTAKTGHLMVRQYEETRRSRIAMVLDLDPEHFSTDDEFETSVSSAASLGLRAVRDGREIVFTTSAEIPPHALGRVHAIQTLPTLTPRALLDAMSSLEASANVMPFEAVASMTAREAQHLSLVFLFTGSLMALSEVRKAAVAFPSDVTVVAVRCEPGAQPSFRSLRELHVITLGMLHDLGHLLLRTTL